MSRLQFALLGVALLMAACTSSVLPDPTDLDANNFTQSDTSGRPVTLSDQRGNVVLVQFWATWCGPCRAHTPAMKELWNKHRDKAFRIIGVSLDDDLKAWKSYIADEKLDWLHTSDGKYWDNAVVRQFDIRATPSFILFNKQGARVGNLIPFRDLDVIITDLLAE